MRSIAALFGISAVAGISFLGYSQHVGYQNMNTEDGYNLFCELDRNCRKLTDNEITLAKTMFGDSIDYSQVNVFTGLPADTTLSPQQQRDVVAAVRYGNLYIPENFWQYDLFSRQSVIIHEMVHIWQDQNNIQYNLRVPSDLYDYPVSLRGEFSQYGVEQQATIVQNLFMDRAIFAAGGRRSRAICESIARHERLVGPYIPSIGRTAGCTKPMI
jgi:hypothetical protein